MSRDLLICGGAGYIGSHVARQAALAGNRVTVLDNLATGHREAVRWGDLLEVDIRDADALRRVFRHHRFDAVLHLCALSLVGESVAQPYLYYDNNVAGTLCLLQAMHEAGLDRLVFSSTAAVYGHPRAERIDEAHPCDPINPYGASKRIVECMLADAAAAYGLRSVALRYFNAAGASEDGDIGEAHTPETHLIPNVLRAALATGPALKVFGDDYPTPDGTCVRDYVHVDDLARAHLQALDLMDDHPGAQIFNLGHGEGFSVRAVIDAVRAATGRPIDFEIAPRRLGDPAVLVAASEQARQVLGWEPRCSNLEQIIQSAWRWHAAPAY